ncbi:MAG: hypothetical protein ABF289_13645 [Clostridiales bacterium]
MIKSKGIKVYKAKFPKELENIKEIYAKNALIININYKNGDIVILNKNRITI